MKVVNELFTAGWVCGGIGSIIFFASYYYLKLKKWMVWQSLIYLTVITGVSVFFSGLTTAVSRYWRFHRNSLDIIGGFTVDLHAFMMLVAFMVFAALNYALWRGLFKLTRGQALYFSVAIGAVNMLVALHSGPIYK